MSSTVFVQVACIQVLFMCVYEMCVCVCVLSGSIALTAGVLEGQLFDLGAVPGLSTRCAGWSPIMLG